MGVIQALSPEIVAQIAAGEVVERPALAIKEMVENSIDAGATAITVEIRDGGITWFRVTDNGKGILPEDIRLAFARHATSKLRTAEGLSAIETLGFRGEALASIAAVSHVEMKTRAKGQNFGVKALVSGGVIESIEETASAEGTSITVKDLFYNVPVRKKFLGSASKEAGSVSDYIMRLILTRPDISIRLFNADRLVYRSAGNGKIRDAMFSVMGSQDCKALTEINGSAAGAVFSGFVGTGDTARSTRNYQTFILNGRYIKNASLSSALEEACRERVMIGKHPICAIYMTMPYDLVDVNVHPNKLEVRFRDERALMVGLSQVVRQSFHTDVLEKPPEIKMERQEAVSVRPAPRVYESINAFHEQSRLSTVLRDSAASTAFQPAFRQQTPLSEIPASRPTVTFAPSAEKRFSAQESTAGPEMTAKEPLKEPAREKLEQQSFETEEPKSNIRELKILGVAWAEYILAEYRDTLYLVDQHAVHERLLYEKMMASLAAQTISQPLLVPQVVELTHRDYVALLEAMDDLKNAGFDLEDFGSRSVQVRAVPCILGASRLPAFLGDLSECLSEMKNIPEMEKRRDILLKHACRKAVKAGDTLSKEEISHLIEGMLDSNAAPTCPHGRPLVVALEKREIDKRFRRIV